MDGFLQRQVSLVKFFVDGSFNRLNQKFTSFTSVRSPVILRFFLVLSFVWRMKRRLNMAAR